MKERFYGRIEVVCLTILSYLLMACGGKDEMEEIEPILYGNLEIHVQNEYGQNLEGAKVSSGSSSASTNKDGICRIITLQVGTHDVHITKEGYMKHVERVTLTDNNPVSLHVKLKSGEAELSVDKTKLQFKRQGGKQEINIASNAKWTIKTSVDWITFDKDEGNGSDKVNVSVSENNDTIRKGEVLIEAGEIKWTINVIQEEPIRVMDIRYELGSDGSSDYIEIDYNMPINLSGKIEEPWNTSTTFEPEYKNGRKTLRVNYGHLWLGGEYTFKFPVKNESGDLHQDPITVNVYTHKWEYEGRIRFFRLDNDGKTAWATMREPNRLVQISLDEGHIIKSYDLPRAPGDFTLNPHNGMIYVTFTDQWFSEYNSSIAVIDPKTGNWVTEIPFDFMDDEQYPMIYPFEIEFTKQGWGMVLVCSKETSGHLWCYIDSTNDHRIIRSPEITDAFGELYLNYDQTKLVAMPPFKNSGLFFVDGVDSQPTPYKMKEDYNYGNFTGKAFHRKRNTIFIAAPPYFQFLLDADTDTYSELTFASSFEPFMDFDYSAKDSNRVWYFYGTNEKYLYVLDMDRATWLFHHPTEWYGMLAMHCLLNERYMLIVDVNRNDPVSSIYLMDIKDFNRHMKE